MASIVPGKGHSCAVHLDGTVSCWGDNQAGQLGLPVEPTQSLHPVPEKIPGLTGVKQIASAGAFFTCALWEDSSARCWGSSPTGTTSNSESKDPTPRPLLW